MPTCGNGGGDLDQHVSYNVSSARVALMALCGGDMMPACADQRTKCRSQVSPFTAGVPGATEDDGHLRQVHLHMKISCHIGSLASKRVFERTSGVGCHLPRPMPLLPALYFSSKHFDIKLLDHPLLTIDGSCGLWTSHPG